MIKIIADSTCDLSKEILQKYEIDVAPLTINLDGKTYSDRVDINTDKLFELLGFLDKNPTTAMPSPAIFKKLFDKAVEDGYDEILCICMSSGTSGTYQSCMIAYKDFIEENSNINIHIVDSKSMSHGSGYLILKSALLREKGATFEELVDFNETYKTNVKHFLAVSDLDNLIRSGRLTNVSAVIGKILKVKPIMSMKSGKGAIVAKVRGEKKVFAHYISEFKKRVDPILTDFIIVGYTSDILLAQYLKSKIQKETNFSGEIYIMQMGVSVSTHVGLGGISMYFIEKGHRHDGLIYNEMHELMAKKDKMLKMISKYKNRK